MASNLLSTGTNFPTRILTFHALVRQSFHRSLPFARSQTIYDALPQQAVFAFYAVI